MLFMILTNGGISLRKLNAAVDRFAWKHPRFGIPNLMRYIVIISAVVFLLDYFSNGAASYMLYFDAGLILEKGELWRLITWLFVPSGNNIFWTIIGLFCYYSIGSSVEGYWGRVKFNLFYLSCVVITVVLAFVSLLWTDYPYITNGMLNNVLFLVFATLFPTAMIRIQFIIPIQAKWLAALYVVLTIYDIFKYGLGYLIFMLPMYLGIWLPYLVFFWDRVWDLLAEFGFRFRHQNSKQTIQFKSAVRQQKKKDAERGYRHKCAVCGRTDASNPELEFRYCSRCAGYHCFCQDHIFQHEHFTE